MTISAGLNSISVSREVPLDDDGTFIEDIIGGQQLFARPVDDLALPGHHHRIVKALALCLSDPPLQAAEHDVDPGGELIEKRGNSLVMSRKKGLSF